MSRRSLTLSQLTSSVPDVITPATMIPPQVGPASASSISATADSPAMGNFVNSPGAVGATSTTTTSATSITTTPNDLSTIQVLSIFRGHLPLDCSVPADRPGRMVVMKVFAKKVQHSKSIRFVNMLFDGESVKLLETLSPGTSSLPDDQQQQQQQKEVLLEIKGTAIDVVRLSKRDPTFFYFTTRNASWTDDQAAEGQSSSPLLNYPMGGDCSSITGFDVFAFHATSPRAAERCYRLLHQFSEINAASEQLMVKFGAAGNTTGGGKASGSSSGGFFHLAGSFLSSPSMMAVVTEAAINHANLNNNNPAIITNHNNNNITLPYLSHCDGKSSKSMSSSVKSILVGNGGGSGSGGEPREAHRVTFVSGLERKRGYEGSYYGQEEEEESSASASPPQSSMPASADLLLCDFSSAERQHSDTSMSDLFDDLAPTSSSGGQAPRAKVLAAAGEEVDLLGDLFKPTAPTLFPPVQQQQQPIAYLPPPPPLQQRPMEPSHLQQQQPMFVPSNPFVAPSSTPVAPAYGSFAPLNPFATGMPLQPQPVQMMMNSGASSGQYQSLCSGGLGTQPSRKSLNSTSSSAFSTDFNDFLQQTVKGHFKA